MSAAEDRFTARTQGDHDRARAEYERDLALAEEAERHSAAVEAIHRAFDLDVRNEPRDQQGIEAGQDGLGGSAASVRS